MRVFKTTYKTRDGKRRQAAKWYVEFRDHLETVRRLPAFMDKKQSEELGRKIEKLLACRANGEAPDVALSRWLESMPGRIRGKLADIGILDSRTVAAGEPLAEHVDDFVYEVHAKVQVAFGAAAAQTRRAESGAEVWPEGRDEGVVDAPVDGLGEVWQRVVEREIRRLRRADDVDLSTE